MVSIFLCIETEKRFKNAQHRDMCVAFTGRSLPRDIYARAHPDLGTILILMCHFNVPFLMCNFANVQFWTLRKFFVAKIPCHILAPNFFLSVQNGTLEMAH